MKKYFNANLHVHNRHAYTCILFSDLFGELKVNILIFFKYRITGGARPAEEYQGRRPEEAGEEAGGARPTRRSAAEGGAGGGWWRCWRVVEAREAEGGGTAEGRRRPVEAEELEHREEEAIDGTGRRRRGRGSGRRRAATRGGRRIWAA